MKNIVKRNDSVVDKYKFIFFKNYKICLLGLFYSNIFSDRSDKVIKFFYVGFEYLYLIRNFC